MIHRLIAMLILTAVTVPVGAACAQGVSPAPLPGQGTTIGPPSSPLAGAAPTPGCMKDFIPLREDAENKGKLIKAAGERHASSEEACKLITSYGVAEVRMIKYVDANASQCGIPTQVTDQLRASHKNTEALQARVCAAAERAQRHGPRGPVGDFPDPVNARF